MMTQPNTDGRPAAYIRRSVARTSDPGDVSRQFQTEKVRALAGDDGSNLRIIDGDWGRSAAGEKTDKRLAFLALLDAVERGEVSTLYAYSADRLARSVRWSAQLLDACEAAGTTIVTGEGRFAPGDDMARQMFHFQAMQNEGALRQMVTKSSATASKRKERGDAMGRAPYGYIHSMVDGRSQLVPRPGEDPAAIVAAFRLTGTYNGTAKLLNANSGEEVRADDGSLVGIGVGLPTRFAGKYWDASTVRHVIMREAKELVPVTPHQGSPARSAGHIFARLLVCPHSELHPARPYLTVSAAPEYIDKKGARHTYNVNYYCAVAHVSGVKDHPRPYMISEAKVLEWAKRETKDIERRLKVERKGKEPDAEAQLAALDERRAGIGDAYVAGAYGPAGSPQAKAAMTQRLAAIDAEVPALELRRRAMSGSVLKALPIKDKSGIDWTAAPAEVNARLRELWQSVELDPATMLPVRAVWTFGNSPAERAESEAWLEARRYGPAES